MTQLHQSTWQVSSQPSQDASLTCRRSRSSKAIKTLTRLLGNSWGCGEPHLTPCLWSISLTSRHILSKTSENYSFKPPTNSTKIYKPVVPISPQKPPWKHEKQPNLNKGVVLRSGWWWIIWRWRCRLWCRFHLAGVPLAHAIRPLLEDSVFFGGGLPWVNTKRNNKYLPDI